MINIHSVRNHLESEGWFLISNQYKNLQTPIQVKCPQGHIQEITYASWRKRPICDQCEAGDPYKLKKHVVPPKSKKHRILALDAATNTSGFSLYDESELLTYGTYHTSTQYGATERINEFKHWLLNIIDEWAPDLVFLEHIQLQTWGHGVPNVENYRVLANLQGVIMDTLYELQTPCELVRASEWRKVCGISEGDQHRESKKKQAQAKVKTWYQIDCTEDEADAICIGKYGVHTSKQITISPVTIEMWGE